MPAANGPGAAGRSLTATCGIFVLRHNLCLTPFAARTGRGSATDPACRATLRGRHHEPAGSGRPVRRLRLVLRTNGAGPGHARGGTAVRPGELGSLPPRRPARPGEAAASDRPDPVR